MMIWKSRELRAKEVMKEVPCPMGSPQKSQKE